MATTVASYFMFDSSHIQTTVAVIIFQHHSAGRSARANVDVRQYQHIPGCLQSSSVVFGYSEVKICLADCYVDANQYYKVQQSLVYPPLNMSSFLPTRHAREVSWRYSISLSAIETPFTDAWLVGSMHA